MNATEHHTDLDRLMEQRRIELRMTWGEVAAQSGITRAGLGMIRRGERRPVPLTQARIEDALQWAPGSVEAILDGGKPTLAPEGVRVQIGHLVVGTNHDGDGAEDADDDEPEGDDEPTAENDSTEAGGLVRLAQASSGGGYRDVDEQYIWLLDELPANYRREIIGQLRRARLRRRKAVSDGKAAFDWPGFDQDQDNGRDPDS